MIHLMPGDKVARPSGHVSGAGESVGWGLPHIPQPEKAHPLFRRTKAETPEPQATKPGGKGRPTPTRKEAEAAAKARAKVPRTRKEIAKAQKAQARGVKSESMQTVRKGMKQGDERYLLPRDKGPMRRFVRDYIDHRFSILELMIPLLILTMILGYSGNTTLAGVGNTILFAMLAVAFFDIFILRRRLRAELDVRFPGESTKGITYYSVTRAIQMKFMRMPKAKVKIGEELPDHYR